MRVVAPQFGRALNWLAKVEGSKNSFYWATAVAMGILVISLSAPDQPSRMVLPVLVMIVYALIGYRSARQAGVLVALRMARLAQLADSLYFLGFLWTLWALIDSFVLKGMNTAAGVFRVFGYALATTASGMFLRLLLLQFRYRAEDQYAEATERVEDQLAKFCAEVEVSLHSLSQLREGVDATVHKLQESISVNLQLMESTVQDVNRRAITLEEALNRINEATVHQINVNTSSLEQAIWKIHRDSAAVIKASVEGAIADLIAELRPSLTDILNANMQLAETLRQQTLEFQRQVAGISESVSQAGAQTSSQLASVSNQGVSTLRSTLSVSNNDLAAAVGEFQARLLQSTEAVNASVRRVAERIETIQIPQDVNLRTDNITRRVQELDAVLGSLTKTVREAELQLHAIAYKPGLMTRAWRRLR